MTNKFPKISTPFHKAVRNAFDLSARHLFNAPVGALLPIQKWHCEPDDYFEINISDFMRAMPMNSAAFIDAKGTYEFFFVPYHQLYQQFDQMITSMVDYHSAFLAAKYGNVAPATVPTFNLDDLWRLVSGNDSDKLLVNAKDVFGFPLNKGANRMCDFLGYGSFLNSDGTQDVSYTLQITNGARVNLFPFLAYQKIYQDIYRNTQYEQADPLSYNIDNKPDKMAIADIQTSWFTMRYRNYGLDYLTNLRPTPLVTPYTANPVSTLAPQNLPSMFGDDNFTNTVMSNSNGVEVMTDPSASMQGGFSISSLRAAFAYEKLLDYMNRAPKTYADQMKAIFGVNVPTGRDRKVQYVGGFDSSFQIGDVNQTSSSLDQNQSNLLGHLGSSIGKMTGSGSGSIKFHAQEHGILMCIYSIIPSNTYDGQFVDPFNVKAKRNDYYNPMYDRLGMQPLYAGFVDMRVNDAPLTLSLGWQPRYSEYKCALDRNHGQFIRTRDLSAWTSNRIRGYSDAYLKGGIHLDEFKINPHIFDSCFQVAYNANENTDPFFGEVNFNVMKVSNMDTDSLPLL